MIYKNNDFGAALAMERQRTGNYGEDGYSEDFQFVYCDNCCEGLIKDYDVYIDDENGIFCCEECKNEYAEDDED